MSISVTCSNCGRSMQAKLRLAGKRVKCPACSTPLTIPLEAASADEPSAGLAVDLAESAAGPMKSTSVLRTSPGNPRKKAADVATQETREASPDETKEMMRKVLAAFDGECRPVRPKPGYLVALALTAPALLLLVAVYLVLVALAAYGTYWHFTENTWILTTVTAGARARMMVLFLYVTIGVAGAAMVIVMLKPLIPGPRRYWSRRELKFTTEPVFHSYVERIAQAVHAPVPGKIEVINEVNAYASTERRFLGLLGKRLTLVVGMPLIAGLDTQQLAGVIAHELGHFSQGAGSRASSLIHFITSWFAKIALGKDAWDDWIAEMRDSDSSAILVLGYAITAANGIVRGIFHGLLYVSHAFSCVVMRRMEYDADRYQVRLVGGKCYESTSKEVRRLSIANQIAILSLMRGEPMAPELPEHYSAYLMEVRSVARKQINEILEDSLANEKASLFLTHPLTRQRIAAAQREQSDPVFTLKLPARKLLNKFDKHAEAVSPEGYRQLYARYLSAF